MENTLNLILTELSSGKSNILDVESAFEEYQDETSIDFQSNIDVDIDSFDCVSIPVPQEAQNQRSKKQAEHDWHQFAHEIQTGQTVFWDQYDDFILADLAVSNFSYKVSSPFYYSDDTDYGTLEETLALFESWAGTPVDILSCYGDFEMNHNIFEEDFDMDVPVRIYTSAEEVIVKANFPWMKSNSQESIYPSELNLKSVLSVLPVRVNSQEVKASFVNGEFKLEFPKEQKEEQRIKKSSK